MGGKFRPMSEADYLSFHGFVRYTGSGNTFDNLLFSLDSSALFGESDGYGDSIRLELERLHRRAVIALYRPTFNYVLARNGANLLWKILGVNSTTGQGIVNMTLAMNCDERELKPIEEFPSDARGVLLGAEVALAMIDDFDFEEAIHKELYSIVSSELKDTVEVRELVKIVKGSGDFPLLGNYYINILNNAALMAGFKRGHSFDTLRNFIDNGVLVGHESRITYLMNMNRDKSGLYGMINSYITVVPYELRPKVQNREHKLTTRYAAVLTANNELKTVASARANLMDVQNKYLALDRTVSKLQYKNQGTSSNVAQDDLSIMERLKGKKGKIRMTNLGKRTDYSARAVVVINPYLPLDMIKIPRCMIPDLFEYHVLPYLAKNIHDNNQSIANREALSSVYDKIKLTNLQDKDAQEEMLALVNKYKLAEKIPVALGRQPTLHKQGIQSFYWGISESQAVEVNPLVCERFNMDFDGDTGHEQVFLRQESIEECVDLLLTTQSIYLAKNGECSVEPRQDMLYGLYYCTRSTYRKGAPAASYSDVHEVREAVIKHKLRCGDTVNVSGKPYLAGEAAFISCFPRGMVVQSDETPGANQLAVCEINAKTITKYVMMLLRQDSNGNLVYQLGKRYASTETFVGSINHLVELGFKVAFLETRSMSLLAKKADIEEFDTATDRFYDEMEEFNFLYDMGFMTASDYQIEFSKRTSKLSSIQSKHIFDKLGPDSCFTAMAKSGTRGKEANLVQMFGAKGIMKKNSNEAFDAWLPDCYCTSLSPLGHFVAAYGGRQGQMDKTLKTADTGYMSRKLWHATQGISIVSKDCGTKEGLLLTKNYFTKFLDPDSSSYYDELRDLFAHAIVGRYTTDGKLINEAEAKRLAEDASVDSVTIRSPLKCKNVCCSKCYGIDWSTHRLPPVGTLVGIIAAQAVGEPTAQLTMKQFQKGGIANASDVTSAFDKMDAYVSCTDLANATKKGGYVGYDPLAWADGEVIETPGKVVTEKVVRIGNVKNHRIVVPASVRLKKFAVKGEGLSYRHGDYSIREILSVSGIEEAQKYLIYKLYDLFKSECNIMMCHFELIAAAMTRYMIVDSGGTSLKVGQYYSREEFLKLANDRTRYVARLLSVQDLPQVSQEALDTILMENQGRGLSRCCALELTDTLTKPLTRIALGKTIVQGSAIPGYVEERKIH